MDGPNAEKEKKEKPLGGAFSHTYAYDELNRLVRAEGKAKGLGYAMDMSFGLMGEPLTKVQRTDSGSVAGIFQNAYGHGANVVTAGQKDYQMRMMQIERQRENYYRKLGTPPGVPTMKGATAEPENELVVWSGSDGGEETKR